MKGQTDNPGLMTFGNADLAGSRHVPEMNSLAARGHEPAPIRMPGDNHYSLGVVQRRKHASVCGVINMCIVPDKTNKVPARRAELNVVEGKGPAQNSLFSSRVGIEEME